MKQALVNLAAGLALLPPAALGAQLCVGTEEQKVIASDLAAGDIFGGAVAADGNVVLVAGEWNDEFGMNSGSMYSYRYDGTSWIEEQRFEPTDSQPFDNFGRSVSVHQDVAVIGAHVDDDLGNKSGSAYVYRYDGSQWVQDQKLLASDGQADDRFGVTVSVRGDVIGVGAWREGPLDRGAAYIYRYNGSTWVQEQKLTASDAAPEDNFGRYVSVSGNAVLVSAWKDDDGGLDSGSAYVFRFNGSTWGQEQKLTATDAAAGDLFGWAAYLDGNTAVVGSYRDDDAGTDSGSAYVFEYDGFAWTQAQKLVASDAKAGDYFGYAVDLALDRLLIGAPLDFAATGPGSAYLFRHDGSTWIEHRKLVSSDGANQDQFGFHVGLAENVAVSGAWRDDDAGPDSGAAYIYEFGGRFANPLDASPCTLSLTGGGSQTLLIDLGAGHAGSFYWIFGSTSGTSPGITFPGGINLPLNVDAYFNLTLTNPSFAIFSGFQSVLDGDGEATASLDIPPGVYVGLVGTTLYHALLVSSDFATVDAASNAVEVLLEF